MAPESSVAVKLSVTDALVVLLPFVGEVMVTTGGVLSSRVTSTDAELLLFEASEQLTVIVFNPKASGRLLPLAKLQVGAAPELSTAV